jgi:hypothetical protein
MVSTSEESTQILSLPDSELSHNEDLVHSYDKQAGQPRWRPDASPSSPSCPLLSAILSSPPSSFFCHLLSTNLSLLDLQRKQCYCVGLLHNCCNSGLVQIRTSSGTGPVLYPFYVAATAGRCLESHWLKSKSACENILLLVGRKEWEEEFRYIKKSLLLLSVINFCYLLLY